MSIANKQQVDSIIRTVNPSSAKEAIKAAMKVRLPVFITGPAGIGKSDIIRQIGIEENRPVIDIRLCLFDPTEIKGMPFFDTNTKKLEWAPSSEFPSDSNSNAIIFLDEFTSAAPAVQAAAYQLILDRRVGKYTLPENVDIIAAGNGENDRGLVYKTLAPLCSRFVNLTLKPDFDSWFEWAVKNRIHKDVIGYITFMKQDLSAFDPLSPSRSYPCPRTWEFVSRFMYQKESSIINENTLLDLISGCIGDGVTHKFNTHRKIANVLPDPMEVLTGKITDISEEAKEISALYSMIISLCYSLKDAKDKENKNFYTYQDNYIDFCMKHMQPEMIILAFKILISQYKIQFEPAKLKNYKKFKDKYMSYLTQSF